MIENVFTEEMRIQGIVNVAVQQERKRNKAELKLLIQEERQIKEAEIKQVQINEIKHMVAANVSPEKISEIAGYDLAFITKVKTQNNIPDPTSN